MPYDDRYGNRGSSRNDRRGGGGGGRRGSSNDTGYAGYGVYQRPSAGGGREISERDFYKESKVQKTLTLNCPYCRTQDPHQLNWLQRHRIEKLPAGADDATRAKFEKSQSYMVLLDDYANCPRCRKRFEISGVKTMAFL